MFRKQFLIGCIFIVLGFTWPTMTIRRGLTTYSNVYRSAIAGRREVGATQQHKLVYAVESASASILGGVLTVLFGIGLTLGKRDDHHETPDPPSMH
jgi:hypothetical protein